MQRIALLACITTMLFACADVAEQPEETTEEIGQHESALTAPAGSTGWVARHGLTSSAYQDEFNKWVGQGYRLTYVSGYEVNGSARYAAIWDKASGPAWVARHGLTSAQYQAEFNTWVAQGFRPVLVNGYGVGGSDYYVAIFEKSNAGGAWVARHGMSATQYQAEFDKWTGQGFRPLHISAYTVAGQARFAAVWVQTGGPAWVARHGMSSSQYQAEFNYWTARGFQLTKVSGYASGNSALYAALWEQVRGAPPWTARHGLTSSGYQTTFDDLRYQGYRPVLVSGYDVGGTAQLAAIWVNLSISGANLSKIDQIVAKYMNPGPTAGLSLAISKDGRLVFAKGFGRSDKSTGEPVHWNSQFRIASVSKPITSAAILRLVEEGRLGLDERVFGVGGVLGFTYGTLPYNNALRMVTVRHLLTHTVGEFTWSNEPGAGDPMFQHPEMSTDQLITWTLDAKPLTNPPGSAYHYSNFGYCLLGRIIEVRSGLDYETYVKSRLLTPAGAGAMTIGGDTLAQRRPNEVVYYANGAYDMRVHRMDSHGGWIASPIDLVRFAVRVDKFSSPPDYLTPGSLAAMTTGTGANPSYGFGWVLNALPNYWHNGGLPGTSSELVRTAGGYNWAVITNSTGTAQDPNLDAMMWEIINGVTAWPTYDLF